MNIPFSDTSIVEGKVNWINHCRKEITRLEGEIATKQRAITDATRTGAQYVVFAPKMGFLCHEGETVQDPFDDRVAAYASPVLASSAAPEGAVIMRRLADGIDKTFKVRDGRFFDLLGEVV